MDPDEGILREKALLLISRERELFALRNKHQRVISWLELARSLPEIVSPQAELGQICESFRRKLISLLKLQRVAFWEILPGRVRPFAVGGGDERPLPEHAAELLRQSTSGVCNEPDGSAQQALADALLLYRFMWHRIEVPDRGSVLLVGGFDASKAAFYEPFGDEDVAHFTHTGKHFEILLRNQLLVKELERDKAALEEFNEMLEQRVAERTSELARANREIGDALLALREKDRVLGEDLAQARAFQQSILPRLPTVPPIEFASRYHPLDLVGGDIYDVAEVAPGHYRVFVADATGHGVQASLRTIVLKGEYERLKTSHPTPESLLAEFNRRLVALYPEREILCTGCCFDLRLASGTATLRYASAAHPPLLRAARSSVEEVYCRGSFLGLSADLEYEAVELALEADDVLVAYTDGICDQVGPEGTMFDLRRAIERATRRKTPLPETLSSVFEEFGVFCGPQRVADDVTVVAARIDTTDRGS